MRRVDKLDDYQQLALRTLKDFGSKERQLEYAIVSLCGEAGELANIFKKHKYHNKQGVETKTYVDEASDILWYVACLADALGIKVSEIAGYNIDKLEARYPERRYDEAHYGKEG